MKPTAKLIAYIRPQPRMKSTQHNYSRSCKKKEIINTLRTMANIRVNGTDQKLRYSTFDKLNLVGKDQRIRARLLRVWNSPPFSLSVEYTETTLLFVDEKGAMMNAILPRAISDQQRAALCEGQIYDVGNFKVARCPQLYKTAEHPYVIRYLETTTIRPCGADGPLIQMQQFMVRTYEHLRMLANTGLELADVVGRIKSVKGYGLTDNNVFAPVLIRLLIAPDVEVDMVLLDAAAKQLKGRLNSRESTHSVVLITGVNPERIGDTLYLTTTNATRVFYSPALEVVTHYSRSFACDHESDNYSVDDERVICETDISPLGDLNRFLNSASTQEILLSCNARIVELIFQTPWSENFSTDCGVPLDHSSIGKPATLCCNGRAPPVARTRVEVLVDDGTNYATLAIAAKDILALADGISNMTTDEVNIGGEGGLARAVRQLQGRRFVIHVIKANTFSSRVRNHRLRSRRGTII
ncbi:unnamed protein product [Cochlearia groenlandica]